jgi:hypothetical protein
MIYKINYFEILPALVPVVGVVGTVFALSLSNTH